MTGQSSRALRWRGGFTGWGFASNPFGVIRRGNLTLRIKRFQTVSAPIGVESARRITSHPITNFRRGGKKSIPHGSRGPYDGVCLLYATDGLGNCLIAGPISGTNAGACWSDPGPGYFGTIFSSSFLLMIFAVTLMSCPSSKHSGRLSLFYNGGSGSSWIDVKPLCVDGSSGGFGLSVSLSFPLFR